MKKEWLRLPAEVREDFPEEVMLQLSLKQLGDLCEDNRKWRASQVETYIQIWHKNLNCVFTKLPITWLPDSPAGKELFLTCSFLNFFTVPSTELGSWKVFNKSLFN